MTGKKKLCYVFIRLATRPGEPYVLCWKFEDQEGQSERDFPTENDARLVLHNLYNEYRDSMSSSGFGDNYTARYGFTTFFEDGSPYTPLPPHAARILDAAQKRIAELEAEVARLRDETRPFDAEEVRAKDAEIARLREYVGADAHCPCCGDDGPNHGAGCEHTDDRMDDARIALYGNNGRV